MVILKDMENPLHSRSDAPSGLRARSWSPYLVGAGIGVLSWAAFYFVNKPIGMSTEVSKLSGWFASLLVGMERVTSNGYWSGTTPKFGYETIFLIATALGAFLSSMRSGTFASRAATLPPRIAGPISGSSGITGGRCGTASRRAHAGRSRGATTATGLSIIRSVGSVRSPVS